MVGFSIDVLKRILLALLQRIPMIPGQKAIHLIEEKNAQGDVTLVKRVYPDGRFLLIDPNREISEKSTLDIESQISAISVAN